MAQAFSSHQQILFWLSLGSALRTRHKGAEQGKKSIFLKEGIRLKNVSRRPKTILTLEGNVTFRRTVYAPADAESRELLKNKFGISTVVPLDMALGIDQLPFKITVEMMIDIARRAINAHSYEELQHAYAHDWGIAICDDQIRYVVNELGRIVHNNDTAIKDAAMSHFHQGTAFPLPVDRRKGVMYIEMDGAMFNTRHESDGTTWRENKLGAVFRSLDIVYRKTKTGREAHRIMEREFISYAGDADTFKEHLYAVALKHGLEHVAEVVIISDGAKWIKGFRERFCSNLNVVHILDYSHVKENIYKFANTFIRGAKLGRIRESSLNRPPCAHEAQFETRPSVRTLPSW